MTDESAFLRSLSYRPKEWQRLLVFADWLQDRDDPRADGYRVLGQFHLCPWRFHGTKNWAWWRDSYLPGRANDAARLPFVWFRLLKERPRKTWAIRLDLNESQFCTFRGVGPAVLFDVAAIAFVMLVKRNRDQLTRAAVKYVAGEPLPWSIPTDQYV